MLMTLELSAKEREIMDVLQGVDAWLDRNEIAEKMGKKRLNPHDVDSLEGLVSKSLIERNTQVSGIAEKFVYRLPQ